MLDHINYQLQWNSRVCLQSTWTKSSSKYDRHVVFGKHHLKIAYPAQLPIFFFHMPLYRQIFYWAAWVTCMSTLSVSHLRVHQPSHQDTRPQKNFHRPRSQLHTGKYYILQSLPQMLPYLYIPAKLGEVSGVGLVNFSRDTFFAHALLLHMVTSIVYFNGFFPHWRRVTHPRRLCY